MIAVQYRDMPEGSANSTQNQIEQRLAELPQDVRDAVLSAQLGEHVREIGQRHALHIDQAGVLEDEVMLVMLGFFKPEDFSNQIAAQLRIPAADADAIAQEVNQQIFLPIRESMKRFAESKTSPAPLQNKAPAVVVTEPAQDRPAGGSATTVVPPANVPIKIVSASTENQLPRMPQQDQAAVPQNRSDGLAQASSTPSMPNAEKMLTQTTVAKPIYKADPYREPIEP